MPSLIPTLDTLRKIAPEVMAVEPLPDGGIELQIRVAKARQRLVPQDTNPPTNKLVYEPAYYVHHQITPVTLQLFAGTSALIDHVQRVVAAAKHQYTLERPYKAGDAAKAAREQAEGRMRDHATKGRPLIDVLFEDEAPIDDYTWAGDEPQPPPEPREPERFADDDSAFQARLWRRMKGKS